MYATREDEKRRAHGRMTTIRIPRHARVQEPDDGHVSYSHQQSFAHSRSCENLAIHGNNADNVVHEHRVTRKTRTAFQEQTTPSCLFLPAQII
jgi:hypothetical protein